MRFVVLFLFCILLSSCEKEEIAPLGESKVISIEKYISKNSDKTKKELIKVKRKRKKFKFKLIKKQRAQ